MCSDRSLGLEDPLEGADCHFCGRTADNFHVPDWIWAKVEPILGQHQACFKCFRIAAWHVGLRPDPSWEVRLPLPAEHPEPLAEYEAFGPVFP